MRLAARVARASSLGGDGIHGEGQVALPFGAIDVGVRLRRRIEDDARTSSERARDERANGGGIAQVARRAVGGDGDRPARARQLDGERLPQLAAGPENDGEGRVRGRHALRDVGVRPAIVVRTSSSSAFTIISMRPLKVTLGFQPSWRVAFAGSPLR